MAPLTRQHPIGSRFSAASTALDVVAGIDLVGRIAIVTGGHSGIGLETTRALRAAGAVVVVPVRDPEKGRARVSDIDNIEVERLDLADRDSVDAFAGRFLASGRALDILVNSAGIMAVPLSRDAHGNELHLATNHLGHFRLVQQLWPALRRANGARVVNVSAWAHRLSPVVFDDPNFESREYEPFSGYGQSKTANILHAIGVAARGAEDGIEAFSIHPGSIITTNLSPWASIETHREMGNVDLNDEPVIDPDRGKKSTAQGASTSVWAATEPRLAGLGGVYAENNEVSPIVALPERDALQAQVAEGTTPIGVVPHAIDTDAAERLWSLSERL
jgi:NAD(P)-dependent dehydrogenase (short-subunit alcohol dehydrogenase family)